MIRAVRLGIGLVERELLGGGPALDRLGRDLGGWTPEPIDAACPRCGGSVGPHEVDGAGCSACRGRRLPWARALRLGRYEGELRSAIGELKFRGDRAAGRRLGRQLGVRLQAALDEAGIEPATVAMVVVPTTTRRRMTRNHGVDHTLTLGRAASAAAGVRLVAALTRGHRPPQTSVTRSGRAENIRGSFRLRPRHGLEPHPIVVIVDDIRTTGATLRACCRAVRGAEGDRSLWIATVAVADDRGRATAEETSGGRA